MKQFYRRYQSFVDQVVTTRWQMASWILMGTLAFVALVLFIPSSNTLLAGAHSHAHHGNHQSSPTPSPTGMAGHITPTPTPSSTPHPSQPGATTMPVAMTDGHANSMAMGKWVPNIKYDICPSYPPGVTTDQQKSDYIKSVHDSYKVLGPDGKWYPTWHPPVDPKTGCKFGHEHGSDPHQSPLWGIIQQQFGYDANKNGKIDGAELDTAGLPFGYVNEQYMAYTAAQGNPTLMRHEDHVGHKVEWANNVGIDYSPAGTPVGGSARRPTGMTCNYLSKAHQGTSSKDAAANNLHEVIYISSCSDGKVVAASVLGKFGKAGEFTRICDGVIPRGTQYVETGYAFSNPSYPGTRQDGSRQIIDRQCVEQIMLVPPGKFSGNFYEAWPTSLRLTTKSGIDLLSNVNLLFDVEDANRYIDLSKPDLIGHSMDLCYEVMPNGNRMRGGGCDQATHYGTIKGIAWDDPRSAFRGLHRGNYLTPGDTKNAGGPTAWYTDPLGGNGQTTPFPGSIKQYVSSVTVNYGQKYGGNIEPNVIDREHDDGGGTVHAPN